MVGGGGWVVGGWWCGGGWRVMVVSGWLGGGWSDGWDGAARVKVTCLLFGVCLGRRFEHAVHVA